MHARQVLEIVPNGSCDCCGRTFGSTDQAALTIFVPGGQASIVCVEDYALMMSAAKLWFTDHPNLGSKGLSKLLLDAVALCTDENDSGAADRTN